MTYRVCATSSPASETVPIPKRGRVNLDRPSPTVPASLEANSFKAANSRATDNPLRPVNQAGSKGKTASPDNRAKRVAPATALPV